MSSRYRHISKTGSDIFGHLTHRHHQEHGGGGDGGGGRQDSGACSEKLALPDDAQGAELAHPDTVLHGAARRGVLAGRVTGRWRGLLLGLLQGRGILLGYGYSPLDANGYDAAIAFRRLVLQDKVGPGLQVAVGLPLHTVIWGRRPRLSDAAGSCCCDCSSPSC